MKGLFDFKRGDTVRICLVTYDKYGKDAKMNGVDEAYGIVLSVNATKQNTLSKGIGEVVVRRDNDGSLFTVDLNGQCHNVSGEQFIQVQKCFMPVNSYKGSLVEWLEFIVTPTENPGNINMIVLGNIDGVPYREEKQCSLEEVMFGEGKMSLHITKSLT